MVVPSKGPSVSLKLNESGSMQRMRSACPESDVDGSNLQPLLVPALLGRDTCPDTPHGLRNNSQPRAVVRIVWHPQFGTPIQMRS